MKTLKLTKTERVMLEEGARRGGGDIYATMWYTTHTKAGLQGVRSVDAIKSLVAKGLATDLRHYSHQDCGHRNTTNTTSFAAKITDAGRQAVAV